jgi:hypothetical protein
MKPRPNIPAGVTVSQAARRALTSGVRKGILTVRRRIVTSLCVVVAVLVSSMSIGAHDSDHVTFWSTTIESSGTVAASFQVERCRTGQGANPAGDAARRDQALLIDLIDLRGVPVGWTVLIAASEAQGLSLQPTRIQTWLGNPDLSTMETSALEPLTSVPAHAWTTAAGQGDGLYRLEFDCTRRFEPESSGARPITLFLNLQGVSP